MSLRCIRLVRQLNSRFSSFKLSQSGQLNQLKPKCASISHFNLVNCKYSTTTSTDKNSSQPKHPKSESSKSEDSELTSELGSEAIEKQTKEEDREQIAKDGDEPKKRERYAVNTYPHNPPGLMEFFDDPKNWGEDYVKSGNLNERILELSERNRIHQLSSKIEPSPETQFSRYLIRFYITSNRSILESRRAAKQKQQRSAQAVVRAVEGAQHAADHAGGVPSRGRSAAIGGANLEGERQHEQSGAGSSRAKQGLLAAGGRPERDRPASGRFPEGHLRSIPMVSE